MKKILYLLLITIMIAGLAGCSTPKSRAIRRIKREINVDISDCTEIEVKNNGIPMRDDDYYVKASCSSNSEDMIKQLNSWKKLPLSENLQLIMYGGQKDGVYYGYELAEKVGIPEIKNGLYIFIDRYDESNDKYSDKELFSRTSFNFTIAMYDLDSNIFYYYEFNT